MFARLDGVIEGTRVALEFDGRIKYAEGNSAVLLAEKDRGDRLRALADEGAAMLMICGMYQLVGNAFITVEGKRLPGLGILDVTTQGRRARVRSTSCTSTRVR